MNTIVIVNEKEKNVNENPAHAAFQKLFTDFELSYIENGENCDICWHIESEKAYFQF